MKQFEILDISGDAGIRAFGKDLPELFVNAAIGMYSLITDMKNIQEEKTLEISADGSSLEGLFVSFLNELIFHFDTYGFIGKSITIKDLDNNKVTATASGEEFDPNPLWWKIGGPLQTESCSGYCSAAIVRSTFRSNCLMQRLARLRPGYPDP